jgi:hypothetical protein
VLEGVEVGVEGLHGGWQVVAGIELVSPGAVAARDGAVELGPLGRQLVEGDGFGLAGFFELALNSEPPSTWMAWTGKGISATTLSRKRLAALAVARRKALATVHLATGQ